MNPQIHFCWMFILSSSIKRFKVINLISFCTLQVATTLRSSVICRWSKCARHVHCRTHKMGPSPCEACFLCKSGLPGRDNGGTSPAAPQTKTCLTHTAQTCFKLPQARTCWHTSNGIRKEKVIWLVGVRYPFAGNVQREGNWLEQWPRLGARTGPCLLAACRSQSWVSPDMPERVLRSFPGARWFYPF